MVTPGLVVNSLKALSSFPNPFVCALAWHLGPDVQRRAIANGYNQLIEDDMLESIDWQSQGYRLFEISTLAPSSSMGLCGGMPRECSWSAIRRTTLLELGGFDERFQSPGGGMVNHDYLKRALALEDIDPVVLLGEGTFHQMHGGVATNSRPGFLPFEKFELEYRTIRGESFTPSKNVKPSYVGTVPDNAVRFTKPSIARALPPSRRLINSIKRMVDRSEN